MRASASPAPSSPPAGSPASASDALRIRPLRRDDLPEVVRIHGLHHGARTPAYWDEVWHRLSRDAGHRFVALAAEAAAAGDAGRRGPRASRPRGSGSRLVAFLIGEVREFEFGSEPCGWVFAVGVDPRASRRGAATALLAEASRRFRAIGVRRVRTMVRRNDVPVLSFFRASGFTGGAFVQLERSLVGDEEEGT